MSDRRTFLKQSALGLTAFPMAHLPKLSSEVMLPARLTLVFQGDSITDAFRNRATYYPNNMQGMGNGYVHHIVTHLMGTHPTTQWQCYNRGISGNKVFQLAERWEDDCLLLKPDVLSVLIGVNDFWHTLTNNYEGTVETYGHDFRALLIRTKEVLPSMQMLIGEPFVVKGGTAIVAEKWFPAFTAYQAAAHKVAQEVGAVLIPYQQVFDDALKVAPAAYWCPDGVHPSLAGAYLMSKAWLLAFQQLMK